MIKWLLHEYYKHRVCSYIFMSILESQCLTFLEVASRV